MPVLQGGVYTAQLVSDADLTASTVTLSVMAPDGTVTSPAPSVSGSTASCPIVASLVGTWMIVWTTAGAVNGTVQDQFTCEAPRVDLISLPDLKEELSISPTDVSKDGKLRRWLKAASHVVEQVTGPIRPETRTDLFDGGVPLVVLSAQRATAITTVSEAWGSTVTLLPAQTYGLPVTSDGYVWDPVPNTIARVGAYGYRSVFAGGSQSVRVVYQAGFATIPDDIQLATAELIKHWNAKSQPVRGSSPFGNSQGDDAVMVGNYMVPNAVMELLEPWRRTPQVA